MNLWHVIDHSPTLYLFAVGYMLHVLGKALAQRQPSLEYWQYAAGVATFTTLTLRRLAFQTPEYFPDVILVMFRSGAFALIVYGLAGTLGVLVLVVGDMVRRIRRWIDGQRQQLAEKRRRQQQTTELPRTVPRPSPRDPEADKAEAERREKERKYQQEQQQRRQRARLKSELELMFALDQDRRDHFLSLIQTCDDASLPADEYEDRMDMIQEAVSRYAPRRTRRFASLPELMEYYNGHTEEVDDSDADEEEKDHLKALIAMERQQAIGRLMQA